MREGFENLNDAVVQLVERIWENEEDRSGQGHYATFFKGSRQEVGRINDHQNGVDEKAAQLYGDFLKNQEAAEQAAASTDKMAEDLSKVSRNLTLALTLKLILLVIWKEMDAIEEETKKMLIEAAKIQNQKMQHCEEQKERSTEMVKTLKATVAELHNHKTQYILGQAPSDSRHFEMMTHLGSRSEWSKESHHASEEAETTAENTESSGAISVGSPVPVEFNDGGRITVSLMQVAPRSLIISPDRNVLEVDPTGVLMDEPNPNPDWRWTRQGYSWTNSRPTSGGNRS